MPNYYDEYYAHWKLVPISYALESNEVQSNSSVFINYLNGCFFNHTFITYVDQVCDLKTPANPDITCVGTIWVSHDDQAIILMFRGTTTNPELYEEEGDYNLTVPFPGGGTVQKWYYNAFTIIWNAGLRDALLTAKNTYPSYELWVTGLSLGGGLSSLAAPYISQMGYFDKNNMKLLNFGAMRVGKPDFVARFPSLVPWAYRVVHRYDIVPHWFQDFGFINYAKEIWYNNTMDNGDPWIECDQVESLQCSDSVNSSLYTFNDHQYFKHRSCVKFTTPPPPTTSP
uniref:Fungal lipase-like domain-containing protein n=1 Tax=Acrobeloides nanus TaxID=290746 RepID=A0A914E7Z3_9BILA